MINVNFYERLQGDAHLIIDSNETVLIDAGYGGEIGDQLVVYLFEQGITKIDRFIISHPHRDHYEGIINVVNAGIEITNVYYNHNLDVQDCCFDRPNFEGAIDLLKSKGALINDISRGDKFKLGKSSLEVLFAFKESSVSGKNIDLNDASAIIRWQAFEQRVLFAGDLNNNYGSYLAENHSEELKAEILKVPHHGARGIAPPSFFEAVDPTLMMFPDPFWVRSDPRGEIAFGFASALDGYVCSNSLNDSVVVKISNNGVYLEPSIESPTCSQRKIEMNAPNALDPI